jgi:hypothetical protein
MPTADNNALILSNHMKKTLCIISIFSCILALHSCTKEGFTDNPEARLRISLDTLRFDTVFTTVGSITQSLKIYNDNDRDLRISRLRLGGGNTSFFALNADGINSRDISNLDIAAGDSIYLFVAVTIEPNADLLPFLVQDSIEITCNGNLQHVQLEAYGQNARYLRNTVVRQDTRFTPELPYVILGGLRVDTNVTLTIDPGVRIYLHADAPLVIDGSLQVNGTLADSVVFRGDRLDQDYRDLPASWPGIYFRAGSTNNRLQYARVLNAYQAIVADQPSLNASPKLELLESVIDNSYETGILGIRSSIRAVNCLLSNCGLNVLLANGGNYEFTHNTVASYSNAYLQHKNPVLLVTNWDSTSAGVTTYPLQATFTNNIFWGDNGTVEDEVVVSKRGNNPFSVEFFNNLYKATRDPDFSTLSNNIRNQDPLFDSIQVSARYFDFRLNLKPSPAINKGIPTGTSKDLEGKPRDAEPDMGCYEKQ